MGTETTIEFVSGVLNCNKCLKEPKNQNVKIHVTTKLNHIRRTSTFPSI